MTGGEKHRKPLIEEAQAAEILEQRSEASVLFRRLRNFHSSNKFKPDSEVKPCARCFARFILDGALNSK